MDVEFVHRVLSIGMEVLIAMVVMWVIYRVYQIKYGDKQKLVKKQAFTDPLTGRGNRYAFLEDVDKLIKKASKFAVCFMDLDGFKEINDTMGHDAGDKLLVHLSEVFEQKLPRNALAYRLGGDEFAIIIQGIKTTADISCLLDNLKKELKVPFIIDNATVTLQYSLGVSMYPQDATTRQELVMYADDAMYYIKENGKDDYYFHNDVLKAKLQNKTKMENDLKKAFEESQFGFYLQPRINLNSGEKLCFEALLHWKHPVLGQINSDYFIKQAEEMALIIKLDQFILESVCKKLSALKKRGVNNVKMAVNISNRHMSRKEFIVKLCEIISKYELDKGDLAIELTGNIPLNKLEFYKLMMDELKETGVDIIVSNLELKYEFLEPFKELPIDGFKISSKFASNDTYFSKTMLKDVIRIAKDLNYKTIVGRIGKEEELNAAIKSGADHIQGDYLFKKIEEETLDVFIDKYDEYNIKIDELVRRANK